MFRRKPNVKRLRDAADSAVARGKHARAAELYRELEELEPEESRWPHRRGDALLRLGQQDEAIAAFEEAVGRYAQQGFLTRAAALAKVILEYAPTRIDVLERVDPDAARRLHRSQRPKFASAAEDRPMSQRRFIQDAPILEPSPNQSDNEIRFERSGDSIEIDLSEIFVEPVEPPQAKESARPRESRPSAIFEPEGRRTAEQLARLPATPLFVEMPRRALDRVLLASTLIDLDDGEPLIRRAEPADALFVVLEGALQVHLPQGGAEPILLGEGDVIGESCLLDHATRRADVITVIGARVLSISKDVLNELIDEHPRVDDILFELLSRRLLHNLLSTHPVFRPFDDSAKREFVSLFEVRRAACGTVLMRAGHKADGLYLPLMGQIEVERPGHSPVTAPAGPGTVSSEWMFGGASLIGAGASNITVRVASEALLLRLPAEDFIAVAAQFPTILESLSTLDTEQFS